jgi:hypothetical protein
VELIDVEQSYRLGCLSRGDDAGVTSVPASESVLEMGSNQPYDGSRFVFLDKVTGRGQDLQARAADSPRELYAPRDWDPRIGLAPDDERGSAYLVIERLDLIGMALISVRDLPVER